jgi:putative hydrolase of the HAD superfamily
VPLITLDALGTLVELLPPAPRLVAALRVHGVEVSEAMAAAALAQEIAYYRAHHDEAGDAASLARLRERCAEVLRDALTRSGADLRAIAAPHPGDGRTRPGAGARGGIGGAELRDAQTRPGADARGIGGAELLDALLASLRFRPYPEVPDALRALRDAGHRLVVVSNWDVSLHETLRATGLAGLVDGAISSAEAGAAKPDPRIFEAALALAGGDGKGALHAGDSVEHDVAGARAIGWRAVLVARDGAPRGVAPGVPVIASLAELEGLAA